MIKKEVCMKIKICGIRTVQELQMVEEAGADFVGTVLFFPRSKRNITLDRARELVAAANQVKMVAVTVHPTLAQAIEIQEAGYDYLQVHGDFLPELRMAIENGKLKIPILKAFNGEDLASFSYYQTCDLVEGYVFDAATYGSGKTFDWSVLSKLPLAGDSKLTLLAGGLTPENVGQAMDALQAISLDGVDVSSGVEYEDGTSGKDPKRVLAFIQAVRKERL